MWESKKPNYLLITVSITTVLIALVLFQINYSNFDIGVTEAQDTYNDALISFEFPAKWSVTHERNSNKYIIAYRYLQCEIYFNKSKYPIGDFESETIRERKISRRLKHLPQIPSIKTFKRSNQVICFCEYNEIFITTYNKNYSYYVYGIISNSIRSYEFEIKMDFKYKDKMMILINHILSKLRLNE